MQRINQCNIAMRAHCASPRAGFYSRRMAASTPAAVADALRSADRHVDVLDVWLRTVRAGERNAAADDYLLEFNVSVSAFYVDGARDTGYACAKALLLHSANPARRERTIKNLQFYAEQVAADTDALELMWALCEPLCAAITATGEGKQLWTTLLTAARPQLVAPVAAPAWAPCKRGSAEEPLIMLTITSCKRLSLFTQTVNSMLRCWTDIGAVHAWLCVDDNSSESDRAAMREAYPWMTFVLKTPDQRGHLSSMNIIRDALLEAGAAFWVHVEDDFMFHTRREYVRPAVQALTGQLAAPPFLVRQVLFNRNYVELMEQAQLTGHMPSPVPGIVLHTYIPGGTRCTYWPHYSFQPGVTAVSALATLGSFDTPHKFFERVYADRWQREGFTSAFFDGVHSRHIGRLLCERGTGLANAYDLNAQDQGLRPL